MNADLVISRAMPWQKPHRLCATMAALPVPNETVVRREKESARL